MPKAKIPYLSLAASNHPKKIYHAAFRLTILMPTHKEGEARGLTFFWALEFHVKLVHVVID